MTMKQSSASVAGSEAAGPFSQRHCSHNRIRIAATSDRRRQPSPQKAGQAAKAYCAVVVRVEVFGEAIGKHARSAVGMAGLPFNNAVEVEMRCRNDRLI